MATEKTTPAATDDTGAAGAARETKPAAGEPTPPAKGSTSPVDDTKPAAGETTPPADTTKKTPEKSPDPPPAADADTRPAPPETYALTAPDDSDLEQTDLDAVVTLAKALKLSNAEAQAVVESQVATFATQRATFLTETQAHKEVGGDHLEAAQIRARRVIDRYLPASTAEGAALRKTLDKTGYGNWTPLVVLLSRIGKTLAEDKPLTGGPAHDGRTTGLMQRAAGLYREPATKE